MTASNAPSKVRREQHIVIARSVLDGIDRQNIIYSGGAFWRWRERGVWARVEDREVQKEIHAQLDAERFENGYGRSLVDSILDLIRTESYKSEHQFNRASECINTTTGMVAWDEILRTWTVRPHAKQDYMTVQIPVAYDAAAKCPLFSHFLSDVFKGDADAEDKVLAVFEMIGYSLLTTCRYERFILLVGGGANGKTVLLKIVEALVGRTMACAVQPSQLDNKFQRAHLANKLVNIVTEIAEGAELADAQLKAIVSGELTTAERKHSPPFDFHPFATCWFATNHMPRTRDFSDALFRRAIVLPFNNKFEKEQCDPYLFDKLMVELPGILNAALAAVRGVINRGGFSDVASSVTAKVEWQRHCDHTVQYFEERCIKTDDAKVASGALYADYRAWLVDQGIGQPLPHKGLIDRLVTRYALRSTREATCRYLQGVQLRLTQSTKNVVNLRHPERHDAV